VTGSLTDAERSRLMDMSGRLKSLLSAAAVSPLGTPASAVTGADLRYGKGWSFETGAGTRKDPAEAAYWYALAAAEGHAKAMTQLGLLRARGFGDVKPDPLDAELLWYAAAARGEPAAMYDLGVLLERGIGVQPDPAQGLAWYRRAADRKDPRALAALKRLSATVHQ
jgi:uncharacterized protein